MVRCVASAKLAAALRPQGLNRGGIVRLMSTNPHDSVKHVTI